MRMPRYILYFVPTISMTIMNATKKFPLPAMPARKRRTV